MYTEGELQTILTCKEEGGDIWNNDAIKEIKRKLKEHYLTTNKYQCCYCRKNFFGEFYMVIDIEHILPKKKFKDYMFEPDNLNVACKRCNMNIKGDKTDFIVNISDIIPDFKISSKYHFIHPNLDNYNEHMNYFFIIINDQKLIKYKPISDKGKYTYDYFLLQKLEVDYLNYAQGVEYNRTDFSENIPNNIKETLQDFLKDI